MRPTAFVMNMFYTGLGIARSLGEKGIPVIGLTAQKSVYGNRTRYARIEHAPCSRREPEALLAHLIRMGRELGGHSVIFPTRDDDVVFLDRFREQLSPYYSPVVPSRDSIDICLNKWQTHLYAGKAGVSSPASWMIENEDDFHRALEEVTYPCVLKPVASHHWRQTRNWEIVGGRKAIAAGSRAQLEAEYAVISQADKRAVLQEMILGGDERLAITACYVDRGGQWAGYFYAQKLAQEPEGFGSGCVVQTADFPELLEPTRRLLGEMKFNGVAEVEYKWDQKAGVYKLIEVNPRPWDQHRLGNACGVDLMYLAYCDHAGIPAPQFRAGAPVIKWVADDALLMVGLRSLVRGSARFRTLLGLAGGKRIYGIWSARDPLPFLSYLAALVPVLAGAAIRRARSLFSPRIDSRPVPTKGGSAV